MTTPANQPHLWMAELLGAQQAGAQVNTQETPGTHKYPVIATAPDRYVTEKAV